MGEVVAGLAHEFIGGAEALDELEIGVQPRRVGPQGDVDEAREKHVRP